MGGSLVHAPCHREGALQAGATGIELDVHATADGVLVVCHDPSVDRTTDGVGQIADLTLAEVQALDNAYWWAPGADVSPGLDEADYPFRGRAPEDPMFRIARLEEVLTSFPGVVLNLDIKRTAPVVEPYEEALADLLRRHGRTDDVIVASFLDSATDAFSGYAPEIPTSAGTVAVAAFYQSVQAGEEPAPLRHVALQVPIGYGDLTLVDQRFVDVAHDQGLAVHVWTIEEEAEMERLCGLGVDGIITDRPTVLVQVLERLGSAWRPQGSPPHGPRVEDRGACFEGAQPRPQLGFLPWLAFFLARSLRLLVRLDTVRQVYSGCPGWRHRSHRSTRVSGAIR